MIDKIVTYLEENKFTFNESYVEGSNYNVGFYDSPEGLLMIRVDRTLIDNLLDSGKESVEMELTSLPNGKTKDGKPFTQYHMHLAGQAPKPAPVYTRPSQGQMDYWEEQAIQDAQMYDDCHSQFDY